MSKYQLIWRCTCKLLLREYVYLWTGGWSIGRIWRELFGERIKDESTIWNKSMRNDEQIWRMWCTTKDQVKKQNKRKTMSASECKLYMWWIPIEDFKRLSRR